MTVSAAIYGLAGLQLTAMERAFFRDADPWGFILFKRNCETPEQTRALVCDLRDAVGRTDAPVLIDQEGGRVARLKPPHWRAAPPAGVFGQLYTRDRARAHEATRLNASLLAAELAALGITVDCLPVLDLPAPGAHDIIGDRAFGTTVEVISDLGRVACEALMAGGVLPVIKHMPGHGRARADSHLALPVVTTPKAELEATDFAPFKALADMPLAMSAHVVFSAIDPNAPATTSLVVIDDIIRGTIGFDGLLMTDDLSMKALSDSFGARARAALAAGCDMLLHCNGESSEMTAIAAAAPALTGKSAQRARAALARIGTPAPVAVAEMTARVDELLREV